eukprot:scaffold345_cov134-Cylindrotheca_fusiformis.AAC.85
MRHRTIIHAQQQELDVSIHDHPACIHLAHPKDKSNPWKENLHLRWFTSLEDDFSQLMVGRQHA